MKTYAQVNNIFINKDSVKLSKAFNERLANLLKNSIKSNIITPLR